MMFFKEKKIKKAPSKDGVGVSDGCAMLVAAFFVLFLPCFCILIGVCFLAMFLLGIL